MRRYYKGLRASIHMVIAPRVGQTLTEVIAAATAQEGIEKELSTHAVMPVTQSGGGGGGSRSHWQPPRDTR